MKEKKEKKKINIKPNFAFLVDGETEIWYFNMLKRNEKNIKIDITPKLPQQKALDEQFKEIKDLAKNYNKVFWIVDLDVILKETKEVGKKKEKPIERFKRYRNKLNKKYKKM